ncbi:MAG: hypothetical protein HETSPECPRED_001999 [Heterodermia speciosa]|uniref:Uncharacterized protein n=1 Tax=Heterodermia speciosa TaxID=116794 RepID=A0A8H3IDJ0_9LECA|nr:MAG: hypothetical protein HETSPECPRED_001999 [Heterodermia speciosa]
MLKEMAYGIMGSTRNSFLSTYQTTRPAKCLYFDGASASLWGSGTLDTQMLLVYGNTTGIPTTNSSRPVSWDEYDRARRLCGWIHEQDAGVPGQGIEGIVRMNAGFELIWCNFSSPSLRLVSRLNVSVPLLNHDRTSTVAEQVERPNFPSSAFDLLASADLPIPEVQNSWEREPFLVSQNWDELTSAIRSYSADDLASYREPGIKVLDGDFVNFYSSEYQVFARTIAEQEKEQLNLTSDGFWKGVHSRQERRDALIRLMRRRSEHRVGELSQPDIARFQQSLKRIVSILSQPAEKVSHGNQIDRSIPWSAIHDLVVNNYSKRLLQFRQLLEQDAWTDSWITAKKRFTLLRERSHALLMPYMEYPTNPRLEFSSEQRSRIRKQAQERCKSAYTPGPAYAAPHGEPLPLTHDPIGQAFEEVMEGICSVLISIGYSIEEEWSRTFDRIPDEDDEWEEPLLASILAWQDNIEELTAWLGWAPHWTRCDTLCDWDVSNNKIFIPISDSRLLVYLSN